MSRCRPSGDPPITRTATDVSVRGTRPTSCSAERTDTKRWRARSKRYTPCFCVPAHRVPLPSTCSANTLSSPRPAFFDVNAVNDFDARSKRLTPPAHEPSHVMPSWSCTTSSTASEFRFEVCVV